MSIRPHRVQAFGWVLVAVGFVWLLVLRVTIPLTGPAVMMDGFPSVEKTNNYSGAEVRRQVHLATKEMANRIPSPATPALIMLAGAVLIDFGFRKGKISN